MEYACSRSSANGRVKEIHQETRESYGSRRMSAQLRKDGHKGGRTQARSLMKEAEVTVTQNKRFIQTTDSRHPWPVAENLLDRQFKPEKPNQV
ncbi:MAG: IS3 family transposase [SAR324 cluster bacterium]|nr:IS3 family transposase [SAR324 cluster bacterium]